MNNDLIKRYIDNQPSDVLRLWRKVMWCVRFLTREAHITCKANITPQGHITFRASGTHRSKKAYHSRDRLFLWLRKKDLNPHKQSQSLPCCHYTIPQYSVFRAPRLRLYYYNRQVSSCQLLFRKFLNFFAIIFRHDLSIRHPKIFYVIFS